MEKSKDEKLEHLKYLGEYSSGINNENIVKPRNLNYKLLTYRKTSRDIDKIEKMLYDEVIPHIERNNAHKKILDFIFIFFNDNYKIVF